MTDFELDVYDAVKRIPSGRVASYGQVAEMAGRPRAARAVGNILHKNPWPKDVPCYRVVHSDGRLASAFAFGGIDAQRALLVADGIAVVNGCVDMLEYSIHSDLSEYVISILESNDESLSEGTVYNPEEEW